MSFFEALLWITLNVYHEARSDDLIGKKAIAHVTLNRSSNRDLSIKETVQQTDQFSWVQQVDSPTPKDWEAFIECFKAVSIAMNEKDFTKGATHYHLTKTNSRPSWANKLAFVGRFGSHSFYKKKQEAKKYIQATKTKIRKLKHAKNKTIHRY